MGSGTKDERAKKASYVGRSSSHIAEDEAEEEIRMKENHENEWREEENKRRYIQQQRKRLRNTDPFYPNAYFEQDHAEELAELAKLEEELNA